MATIKQLDKQIETATKRITDFQRKIEMYQNRTNKACAAVNVSINDIIITEREYAGGRKYHEYRLPESILRTIGFEASFRITQNFESMKENERNIDREKHLLASLTEQCNKMINDANNYEKATAELSFAMEQALSDFRTLWLNKMRNWHKKHYEFIVDASPLARQRYDRANVCQRYFNRTRSWSWCRKSRIMSFLENIKKSTGEILSDDAARMGFNEYMNKKEKETVESWNNGIKLLTNKCSKFGLNESSIRVNHPAMTGKGFSAIITDGTHRVIDVRIILAAEYSVLVSPHIRYIATQKTK